jgi:hypothetical protein
MKAAEKKQVQASCIETLLTKFEVSPAEGKNYNKKVGHYIWQSPIGEARIMIDANCKSKVMSLCVNFYENTAIAKNTLGHWKQNIHEHDNETFALSVEMHLTEMLDKIKESDAWMFIQVKETFKKCHGLQQALNNVEKDAIDMLAEKTLFNKEWIQNNLDTIKKIQTEEKTIL